MIYKYDNTLSDEQINYILNLSEVLNAKNNIDLKNNGTEYFNIPLTPSIKESIYQSIGLNLFNIESIPMRWIKGDTPSHVDVGDNSFNNTYLIYLTDSTGDLIIDYQSYSISKGIGYVFNEGLSHETINTGSESRLLLGPMDENGLSVGIFTLNYIGGITVNIRQLNVNDPIEYSTDMENWNELYFPCGIMNNNIENGVLIINFITDITIYDNYTYFICMSSHIQFGLKIINNNNIITTSNINDYIGLVGNGDSYNNGYNSIYIYNINMNNNSSTLLDNAGWLCQNYFSRGANNNYVINCYSLGGLIGAFAGSESGASLNIIGCHNAFTILYSDGGGILGPYAGYNSGNVTCDACWNNGNIGNGCGGIVGAYAGDTNGTVTITNCYNIKPIITSGGGIVGRYGGNNNGTIVINNCYNTGNINMLNSGGIIGEYAQNVTISNCYSGGIGNGNNNSGSICGNNSSNLNITNCYSYGQIYNKGFIIGGSDVIPPTCYSEAYYGNFTWNSTNANTVLLGLPNPVVGNAWVAYNINQPYELSNYGWTPYSLENITSDNTLKNSYSFNLNPTDSTIPSYLVDSYVILQKMKDSMVTDLNNTITINLLTGVISTNNTIDGIYTIYIKGGYYYNSISVVYLTVVNSNNINYLNLIDISSKILSNSNDRISVYNSINAVIIHNLNFDSNKRINTNNSLSKSFNHKFLN